MSGALTERRFDCDAGKRAHLAKQRGFDILDMSAVFDDERRLDVSDQRFDYGEDRRITIGRALGRVFTVVYTQRSDITWLITAWPANQKERARYEAS